MLEGTRGRVSRSGVLLGYSGALGKRAVDVKGPLSVVFTLEAVIRGQKTRRSWALRDSLEGARVPKTKKKAEH